MSNNYNEKSIGYAKDDIDALRKVPQMYGPIGDLGYLHMIKEIFQNSIDEAADVDYPMTLTVMYEEFNHKVSIDDDGRGIPVGDGGETLLKLLTLKHSSGKGGWVESGSYGISAGVHGVGTKLCNALSSELKVISSRDGKSTMAKFEQGRLTEGPDVIGKTKKTGTYIEFMPDEQLKTAFPKQKININANDVYDMIETLSYLTPIGTTVKFHGVRVGNKGEMQKKIKNKDGINTLLAKQTSKSIIRPINFKDVEEDMGVEISMTYDPKLLDTDMDYNITSFANYCTTTKGGTHVDGYKSAIGYFFSKEVKDQLSDSEKKKLNILHKDCWNSLSAVINCWHREPKLMTQTKDSMSQEEMVSYVRNVTTKYLKKFKRENKKDFDRICLHIKKMAEIRSKAINERKVAIKDVKEDNFFSNHIEGFVRATGGRNVAKELFIVEGDSAKGSARDSRDKQSQAIFPVRGKSLNTLGMSEANILKNKEFQNLVRVLKTNIGPRFDADKCEYDKIIIMTDADPDGGHIFALLATFFIYHMPDLVDRGKVYKAIAPLYSFKDRGGVKYVTSYREYLEYVEKGFSKDNTISINGKKISNKESIDLLFRNRDYHATIQRTADLLAINPVLLEYIVHGMDRTDFKDLLKSRFSYIDTKPVSDEAFIVEGVIDRMFQMILVDKSFTEKAKRAIQMIRDLNNNEVFVELNGETITIFELMTILKKYEPKGKERYKGLGEMDSEELYATTMNPKKRTLLKLTYEDLVAEHDKFNSVMGDDAELKRSLMEKFKISEEDIDN